MEKLSPQEEQAMLAIWKTGEGNIKAFMENMVDPPPYTTVASTVKNLEKKGTSPAAWSVMFICTGLFFQKPNTRKKFMNNVVKEYFDNSYKELVSFFVDQKKISAKELKEIINLIEGKK